MTFVVPMIAYEDGNAAMDWLIEAFGFVEADRRLGADGRLTHGELEAGDAIIMLATPTPDYQSPKHHRETCAAWWRGLIFMISTASESEVSKRLTPTTTRSPDSILF